MAADVDVEGVDGVTCGSSPGGSLQTLSDTINAPLFVIEALGHVIKIAALAVRLWANMMGGHTVMFVVFGMIFC